MAPPTEAEIGAVLTGMLSNYDRELFAGTEAELRARFTFTWDNASSPEWNLYKFSGALDSHRRDCRRWEEHHHGSSCVVERVRDKYLMPRIRDFWKSAAAHSSIPTGAGLGHKPGA